MPVNSLDFDDILEKIEKDWKIPGKITTVYTPNAEIVTFGYFNSHFQKIVQQFDLGLPDGSLIVWAGKLLGQSIQKRITGGQVLEQLVSVAAKKNATIGLIGGRAGVAALALERLSAKYPGLKGWSEEGPEIKLETRNSKLEINPNFKIQISNPCLDGRQETQNSKSKTQNPDIRYTTPDIRKELQQLAHKIVDTKTRFVFVAMGCPKQEFFIEKLKFEIRNSKFENSVVLMAVGGVFDVLAGRVKPTPRWMGDNGLEWLWRLVQQPSRIKRQLKLPIFVLLVLFDTLRRISQKSKVKGQN